MILTVYHGTRRADEILAHGFQPSTGGEFGPGVYLTENVGTARFYAEHVAGGTGTPTILEATVELRNPFRVAKTDWIKMTTKRTPRTVLKALASKGHDGILGVGINGHDVQVVAWYPDAIAGARVVERFTKGKWTARRGTRRTSR